MAINKIIGIILRYWLKKSVNKDGVKCPVLISKSGIVLDGNHRVILARKAGVKVPALRLPIEIEWVDPNELKTYYD